MDYNSQQLEFIARDIESYDRKLRSSFPERIDQQASKIAAVLWRRKSSASRKSLIAETRRLAYDIGLCDEALMRLLFKLDAITGDDELRAKRKAQVSRIKDLIQIAEQLRKRAQRIEHWLDRSKKNIAFEFGKQPSETAEVEMKSTSPTPSSATSRSPSLAKSSEESAAQRLATVVDQLKPAEAAATPAEQKEAQTETVPMDTSPINATAAAPANTSSRPEKPKAASRPQTPEKSSNVSAASKPASRAQTPEKPQAATVERKSPSPAARRSASPGETKSKSKAKASSRTNSPAKPAAALQQSAAATDDDENDAVMPSLQSTDSDSSNSNASASASKSAAEQKPAASDAWKFKYGRLPRWHPEFREQETRDAVVLLANLGALEDDDLTINVVDNVLTVRGVKKPAPAPLPMFMFRHAADEEYGWFQQQFQLPASIDGDKASASFTNGLLQVTLPKKRVQPRVSNFAQPRAQYSHPYSAYQSLPAAFGRPQTAGYSRRPASFFDSDAYASPFGGFW